MADTLRKTSKPFKLYGRQPVSSEHEYTPRQMRSMRQRMLRYSIAWPFCMAIKHRVYGQGRAPHWARRSPMTSRHLRYMTIYTAEARCHHLLHAQGCCGILHSPRTPCLFVNDCYLQDPCSVDCPVSLGQANPTLTPTAILTLPNSCTNSCLNTPAELEAAPLPHGGPCGSGGGGGGASHCG